MGGTKLERIMLLLAATLFLGCCGSAEAAGIVLKEDAYVIQMSNSNLTVACSSDASGTPLILWPTRPTATWSFSTTGNGYYSIDTHEEVLDGGNGKTGTVIIKKRQDQDWARTMWKVVKVGRYYKFINFKTGQAMTLINGQRTPGSKIANAPVADTMDQLFCIQAVDHVGYCGEGGPYVDYTDHSRPEKKGQAEYLRLLQEGKAKRGTHSPSNQKPQGEEEQYKAPSEENSYTNHQR